MKITLKTYKPQSLDGFLKCLMAVSCAVKDNDMHGLRRSVKQWQDEALPFVEFFSISKSFNKLINQFVKREEDVTEELLVSMVEALAKKSKKFLADTNIPKLKLDMLNRCRVVLKNGSDSAYKNLMSSVHLLGDTELTSYFIPESKGSQANHLESAIKLCKKHLGHSNIWITIDEAKEWKLKSEDSYKKFLLLKRDITAVYKTELIKIFRTKGVKLLDFESLKKILDAKGITYSLPEGYVGRIDEQGKLYTTDGIALQATPRGKVVMNTAYKGDSWYCKGNPSGTGIQSYYDVEYRKSANADKHEKADIIEGRLESIKKGWRKLYDNPTKIDKATSCLIELCYITSSRIGSESGNTAGEKTFGMSSIRVKHVKITSSKAVIKFPGKKGVVQTYEVLTNDRWGKRIVNMLESLSKGKSPSDRVWTVGTTDIKGGSVNKVLRSLGMPEGTGIHKFRLVDGSRMAREILKASPLKRGVKQGEAEKWWKEEAKKIGERLGHSSNVGAENEKTTGMTAIANYISIQLQLDFFENLGLRVPKFLEGKL
jgi:hypothetical protein